MSTPYPPNPRQLFAPKSSEVPLEERPLDLAFTLPDHTAARVVENAAFDLIEVSVGDVKVASWTRKAGDQARASLHGVVQDHRAKQEDIWELVFADQPQSDVAADVRATWIALYGCECGRN